MTGCLSRGDDGRSYIVRAENAPQVQGNEHSLRPTSAPGVYRLQAEREANLSEHVGARVGLKGYLQTVPVHAAGDANGDLQPAPTSGASTGKRFDDRSDMIDMKVFRVTSLEKLGACQ